MALIPLGACECASGSQVCNGTMAILTPKPITNNAPPMIKKGEGELMDILIISMLSVPVSRKMSAMPITTITDPVAL